MTHASLISCLRKLAMAGAPLLFVACSSGPQSLLVETTPAGADVTIDGHFAGTSPIGYTYEPSAVAKSGGIVRVEVQMDGYQPVAPQMLRQNDPALVKGQLHVRLKKNPFWEITTTSNATNKWLSIEIDPGISKEDAWQRLIDAVTGAYDMLEQVEASSGYMRTTEKERSMSGVTVRTQLVATIQSSEPLVWKIKIKSDQKSSAGGGLSGSSRWSPYDRVYREDAEVIEELINRLGRK